MPTLELPAEPRNIVVVHGDPNKENPILPNGRWDADDFEARDKLAAALDQLNAQRKTQGREPFTFTWLCNHDTLLDDLRRLRSRGEADLVLQFCDDGLMNHPRMEMHLLAFLEILGVPYTGSSAQCIALTYDKLAVLQVAESVGVPTPRTVYLENDAALDDALKRHPDLAFPVIVKPNSTDGSYGITAQSVCNSVAEIRRAIAMVRDEFNVDCPILLQEYLTGGDVNVAVLGANADGSPRILPVTEEDYSSLPPDAPRICGFESKWDESSPYYGITTRPTTLDAAAQEHISSLSQRLFCRIGATDYARFDWRLAGDGTPRLLEANPNPGWCWDGHLAKTAALAGISYPEMLAMIIESAWARAGKSFHARLVKPKRFVSVGTQAAP